MSKFPDFTPTPEQRANLLTLAAYLDALPEGYDGFKMADFMVETVHDDVLDEDDYYGLALHERVEVGTEHTCGTCACAVGHGPAAGVTVADSDKCWFTYSNRVFGCCVTPYKGEYDEPGEYMFGVNNPDDPKAAAARIREVLG